MSKLSVIIPARNEPYLQNTIESILDAAWGDIEIIAVLDGWWPDPPLQNDKRVKIIHFSESRGMRPAINAGARIAKGDYFLKCDAHCLFDKEFDKKLIEDCKPNWVVVPRRYGLDPSQWKRTDKLYEFQYIRQRDLKGKDWPEYAERVEGQEICDLMTSQGSCWFMGRNWFWKIGGLDEVNYGSMGKEAQEVCLKTWLSGGRYVLNRKTWYAHWSKDVGLYSDVKEEKRKSGEYVLKHWTKEKLRPLIERFAPVPTWETDEKIEKRGMTITRKVGMNRTGLYRYFASLGFKVGAEIGVQAGRNAQVMLDNIPGLKLYLVDPYRDNPDTRKWGEETHRRIKRRAHRRLDGKNIEWIEDFSLNASLQIPNESLDFVYIDGDHSYDYVMMDMQLWSRKVRKGGIVSGHDYHYLKSKHGTFRVVDAVDDFVRAHRINLCMTDKKAAEIAGDNYASWFYVK